MATRQAELELRELLNAVGDEGSEPAATVGARYHLDRVTHTFRRRCRHRTIDGPLAAAEHLRKLPGHGESLHAITTGEFTGCDLVPAILDLAKTTAREVILTTLSFSRANVDLLAHLLAEKRIRRLTLLASVYFRRTAVNEQVFDYAQQTLDPDRATVFSARVHAKLILLRTESGDRFTVETSGNLRSCLCIEQLAISRDPQLYQFHRRWIQHVIGEGSQ